MANNSSFHSNKFENTKKKYAKGFCFFILERYSKKKCWNCNKCSFDSCVDLEGGG